MKRRLTLLLAAVLAVAMLAGCSKENAETPDTNVETTSHTENTTEPAAGGNTGGQNNSGGTYNYKVGLGVVSHMDNSKDAGENPGTARVDSTVAAVVVDNGGVIIDCQLDGMKHEVKFTSEGKVTTPLDTELKTKNELGDEYGMKAASDIGKEWYEQAEAFQNYVIGMTSDDVMKIPSDEDGVMTDADAVASVTISITDFQKAIQKAIANAR